jgi:hypothetical protein
MVRNPADGDFLAMTWFMNRGWVSGSMVRRPVVTEAASDMSHTGFSHSSLASPLRRRAQRRRISDGSSDFRWEGAGGASNKRGRA